ncbi:MAG: hypothetical protein NTV39_01770 [Candidatus Saccharibacteria bacterium]|nr:hypothetical protein [Candidatus Saccharibacteria bacterium]
MNKKNRTKILTILFIIFVAIYLIKAYFLITGGAFGSFYAVTTWFLWFSLILWLVFIVFFYLLVFQKMFRIMWLIWLFVGFAVVSVAVGIPTGGLKFGNTGSTGGKKQLVECTGTITSPVSKVSGWNTHLYAANPSGLADSSETSTTPKYTAKTAVRDSYSFADLKNNDKSYNIYYYIERSDQSVLPSGSNRIIEVCDSNNKVVAKGSTKDTNMQSSSADVVGSYDWLIPYYINNAAVPGDFRVDAYLYANGVWTLTDRIEKVHIVE